MAKGVLPWLSIIEKEDFMYLGLAVVLAAWYNE